MNRNRYKKVVAIATATTVAVGSLTGCQASTETSTQTKTEASNETTTKKESKTTANTVRDGVEKKTETVFAKADAAGTVNEVTVSNWLKNGKGDATIADITDLTDIKNVKGDEPFQLNGGKLDWTANGNDIYYQGKTSKALPVTVKVTYTLDGVEIKPEELAGKSGHVKIRFDYTNNEKRTVNVNGKDQEVSVPFAIMTGTILDNEKFANVTVTNGQIVNDGNRIMVAGFSLPGLKDTLFDDIDSEYKDKVDDIDIPSFVEVEADATDFQVDMTLSVVLNDFFNDINTDDFNKADDIKDKVKEMKDKFGEIVTGCEDLDNGMATLQEGGNKLDDGAGQLFAGATKLTGNNKKLNDGASALMNGLKSAEKGDKSLGDGLGKLSAGATKLSDGVNGLFKGKESLTTLKEGTDQLVAGFNTKDKKTGETLLTGSKKLADETKNIDKMLDHTMGEISKQVPGMVKKQLTTEKINQVVGEIQKALGDQYIAAVENQVIEEVNDKFDSKTNALLYPRKQEAAKKLTESKLMKVSAEDITPELLGKAKVALKAQIVSDETPSQVRGAYVDSLCDLEQLAGAMTAVSEMKAVIPKSLSTEAKQAIKKQIKDKIATEMKKEANIEAKKRVEEALQPVIADITKEVLNDINDTKEMKEVNVQLQTLKAGCAGIEDGINQLYDGSKQIQAGTGKLEYGIRTQLKPGANELAEGAKSAAAGNVTLYNGLKQMSAGSVTLESGILAYTDGASLIQTNLKTLKEGTASAVSGIGQLKEGTAKLSSGTAEFQEKAINKIADVVDKNFDQVKDKLTAVVKAGQSYNSFSGANSDMTSSVKFVIETAAIGDSDK